LEKYVTELAVATSAEAIVVGKTNIALVKCSEKVPVQQAETIFKKLCVYNCFRKIPKGACVCPELGCTAIARKIDKFHSVHGRLRFGNGLLISPTIGSR